MLSIFHTTHPGTAYGDNAIIIKNNIRHHESIQLSINLDNFKRDFLQATTVALI